MSRQGAFPTVRVASSSPFDRGQAVGDATRHEVLESIDAYRETFAHYTRLSWEDIREVALGFAEPIAAYDPEILAEIEGLAVGAQVELADVLALNARSEIMFGLNVPSPPECTSFVAGRRATADGHVYIGQNWDWRPRAAASTLIVEIEQRTRPAFVMLPEAGIVGKLGFNERGIGVTINALRSTRDRGERHVPIHVVLRGILNATTLEEAVAAIVRAKRGASANYTIASALGEAVGVETGPGGVETVRLVHPVDDVLAHSNHFVCDGAEDLGVRDWKDSPRRLETISAYLRARHGRITDTVLEEALSDREGHPDAISRAPNPADHPVEASGTVASVIMDLSERRALIAKGAPHVGSFVPFAPQFAVTPSGLR